MGQTGDTGRAQASPAAGPGRVTAVARVVLSVSDTPLAWEVENAGRIARHWEKASENNSFLFNGIVFGISGAACAGGVFRATCHPIRFAAFLCWRDMGYPPSGFRNVFADVVPRCADGTLIMGRMGPHTANAGRVYFPGGAFDSNDLRGGALDPDACVARECAEEIGLAPPDIAFAPGYAVYEDPHRVAIVRIADLPWDWAGARARIEAYLAAEAQPELAGLVPLHHRGDLDAARAEPYARAIAEWMFDHDRA